MGRRQISANCTKFNLLHIKEEKSRKNQKSCWQKNQFFRKQLKSKETTGNTSRNKSSKATKQSWTVRPRSCQGCFNRALAAKISKYVYVGGFPQIQRDLFTPTEGSLHSVSAVLHEHKFPEKCRTRGIQGVVYKVKHHRYEQHIYVGIAARQRDKPD